MTFENLSRRALKLTRHFNQNTKKQAKRALYAETLDERKAIHSAYERLNQQMSRSIPNALNTYNHANLLWNFACFIFETTEALTACHEEWLLSPDRNDTPTYLTHAIDSNALCIKLMTQSQQIYEKKEDQDSAQKLIDQYTQHQSQLEAYLTTLPVTPDTSIQQDEEQTLIETLMSLSNTSKSPSYDDEYSPYLHRLQAAQQYCLNIHNELNKAITDPDHLPLPLQEELFASLEHLSKLAAGGKKRKTDTVYEPLLFKRSKPEYHAATIHTAIQADLPSLK
ncbi:MAG: hypothetical protein CK426_08545 [Legionella sp.]|nr:MAG: hypothetical protein CK423_07380 [Legionella sp.]PJD97113.1 MAG: hypothetical protein CK426_08545 [Legionella sp.]